LSYWFSTLRFWLASNWVRFADLYFSPAFVCRFGLAIAAISISRRIASEWKSRLIRSSSSSRAARALLRWEQRDLEAASSVLLPTIKRLESKPGIMAAHLSTVVALRKALEAAGIEFIDENGRGPGVRLKKRQQKRSLWR